MSGLGIIINPHSRANRNKTGRAEQFGFIVGDRGTCHETKTLEDVKRLAQEFKERDIDILGISGGDGTYHLTLSIFMDVYKDKPLPKIAFLRGGTMNNIATELGIRGKSEKILSNLILKYHRGESFEEKNLRLMKINDKYGFIFGFGLMNRFMEVYHSRKGYPSPQRAAWVLARCGLSALVNGKFIARMSERIEVETRVDGELMAYKNFTIVFVSTIKNLGLGFKTLYRAYERQNGFHFLGFSVTPRGLARNLPLALLGLVREKDGILDRVGSTIQFKFPSETKYVIDGDEFSAKVIDISIGPTITCIV